MTLTALAWLWTGCSGSIGSEMEPISPTEPGGMGGRTAPPRPDNGGGGTGGTTTVRPPIPDATGQSSASLFTCKAGARPASASRLWRLSATQYAASIRALHPAMTKASFTNPLEGLASGGRFTNMSGGSLPGAVADQVVRAHQDVAVQLTAALEAATPCLKAPDASCLKTAFAALASKAFRRPAEADEVDRLVKLVQDQTVNVGASAATAYGVQAVLNSPHFLFRFELGSGQPDNSGRRKLTGHEIASALAYTLTDGPPDDSLMKAAASNALGTPEQIRAEALRLLGNAGGETATRFVREYFHYERTLEVPKNEKTYAFHAPEQLLEETDQLVKDLLGQRKNFLTNVLTADWGYARSKTVASYNLPAMASTTAQKVTFPAGQRAGLLTQPSFLSGYSQAEENDVVHRGKFIAQSLLCLALPDTPPNAVPPLPDLPNATMRARLSVHVNSEAQCRSCHDIMDPLGLGLEAYDHVGRFRTMEAGKPVDASGEIRGTGTAMDGPFNGAVELGRRLGSSPVVEQCFVRFNFRYWFGRNETELDGCTLKTAHETLQKAAGDPLEMIASLIGSESFLYRQ